MKMSVVIETTTYTVGKLRVRVDREEGRLKWLTVDVDELGRLGHSRLNPREAAELRGIIVDEFGDCLEQLDAEIASLRSQLAYETAAHREMSAVAAERTAELLRTEERLQAEQERSTEALAQNCALREALDGLHTRIESAHIDDWKENDVDWFAILRARDALTDTTTCTHQERSERYRVALKRAGILRDAAKEHVEAQSGCPIRVLSTAVDVYDTAVSSALDQKE